MKRNPLELKYYDRSLEIKLIFKDTMILVLNNISDGLNQSIAILGLLLVVIIHLC